MTEYTPVQRLGSPSVLVKRDDLYERAGVYGGKVRTCWALATAAVQFGSKGLVTAGARHSPQAKIVAHVARELGLAARVHTATGPITPELQAALAAGAEVVQHRPGYNSVIEHRAEQDALVRGWSLIPFGMQCQLAVDLTAEQVGNLPWGEFDRIVIAVGSGMSMAGVLTGIETSGHRGLPVLGVQVGADPTERLAIYAPFAWEIDGGHERGYASLRPTLEFGRTWAVVRSGYPYQQLVQASIGGVKLDPVYEAKAADFVGPGDLFWLVGIR